MLEECWCSLTVWWMIRGGVAYCPWSSDRDSRARGTFRHFRDGHGALPVKRMNMIPFTATFDPFTGRRCFWVAVLRPHFDASPHLLHMGSHIKLAHHRGIIIEVHSTIIEPGGSTHPGENIPRNKVCIRVVPHTRCVLPAPLIETPLIRECPCDRPEGSFNLVIIRDVGLLQNPLPCPHAIASEEASDHHLVSVL